MSWRNMVKPLPRWKLKMMWAPYGVTYIAPVTNGLPSLSFPESAYARYLIKTKELTDAIWRTHIFQCDVEFNRFCAVKWNPYRIQVREEYENKRKLFLQGKPISAY